MVVVSTQNEKVVNHNFILKEFKVKFLVEKLLHSLGNHDFWNLQAFLILKHYLSIKIGWNKCLQEIVLVHHFAVPFFLMPMCV